MRNQFLATLLVAMASSPVAFAHIELQSPTARFVQNNNGLKTAPCGSGTPTGVVTPLVAGQTLTVRWKESVSHSGHYRIALSSHDSDFAEPTSLDIPATLAAWDLADGIPDKTGTQMYSQEVRIPTTPCTACVLQLLQVMGAGMDGTNGGPFAGVYHACADVKITAGSADAGPAPDAATTVDLREADAPADQTTATADASRDAEGRPLGTGGIGGRGGDSATGGRGAGGTPDTSPAGGTSGTARGGAPGAGGIDTSNMTGGSRGMAGSTASSGGAGTASGGTTAAGSAPGHGGSTSSANGSSSGCQVGPRTSATWPVLAIIVALLFMSRWRQWRFGRPTNGAMRSPSWTSSNCDTVAIPIKPRPASTRRTARSR